MFDETPIIESNTLQVNSETLTPNIKDLGQLSDQETANEITQIAATLVESMDQTLSVSEDGLTRLAEDINSRFPFADNGSGVSTLPRQLEHIRSDEDGFTKKQGVDCKLPIAVAGFSVLSLAQKNGEDVSAEFRLKTGYAHPYLLVQNHTSDEAFLIDFVAESPDIKGFPGDPQEIAEKAKWQMQNSTSKSIVRKLDDFGRTKLDRLYPVIAPVDNQGLRSLDEIFIKTE